MSVGVRDLGRLLRLKDRRLEVAQAVLAAAAARLRAAEAERDRREAHVQEIARLLAGLGRWFAAPPADPQLIAAALARQDLLADRRRQAAEALVDAEGEVADAEQARAEAARGVARAQGRRDAAGRIFDRARAVVVRRRETRAELETEERLQRAGGIA